jgi:hypothetical protein
MRAAATPTLTWTPRLGGFRGVSADRQREYWVQPVAHGQHLPASWWAVTTSADKTRRTLIGSPEGAILLAQQWEEQTT